MKKLIFTVAAALLVSSTMFAQLRATDQTGVNVFETPKTDIQFDGPKVGFGGSISMPYIALTNSNFLTGKAGDNPVTNSQALFKNSPNFALAMANLNINSYLADGVTLQVSLYLASKHHNETWVKGGYVQFDKIPFIKLDLLDNIMKYTSIKVGQMDVNYGDAHFRRSDGGNAIYNPFMENYIMDEFATEIGAEADVNYNGIIGSASVTDGNLNPSLALIDTTKATNKNIYSNGLHNPSFILKLGYDKQITDKFRARITGSVYTTAGAFSNTLFGGDRTGSNYSAIMYNLAPGTTTAFNGRFNPGLTDKLTTYMGNLFLKYNVLDALSVESFTTYESAKGRTTNEAKERSANQFAEDFIIRFGKAENFFIGARYNTVSADIAAAGAKSAAALNTANSVTTYTVGQDAVPAYTIGINRLAISGGWYVTKNIMAKVEYSNQKYTGVPSMTTGATPAPLNYILNGYEFHGLSAEAVISF